MIRYYATFKTHGINRHINKQHNIKNQDNYKLNNFAMFNSTPDDFTLHKC